MESSLCLSGVLTAHEPVGALSTTLTGIFSLAGRREGCKVGLRFMGSEPDRKKVRNLLKRLNICKGS
jgi:hypothetical protein